MTFEDDFQALMILSNKSRWLLRSGVISPAEPLQASSDERDAINYLCCEWDYCYDPSPAKDSPIRPRRPSA